MRVWIDLANSPHVPFFSPLYETLRARRHEVMFTARDFSQTVPLARARGWDIAVLGQRPGASILDKGRKLMGRAGALARWAFGAAPDLALSHNSYAQCIAARALGLPCATLMDYEYTPANHVGFRLADLVIVPEILDPASLRRYGAKRRKLYRYPGIKEQIYLTGFIADPAFGATEAGRRIDPSKVLVLARPPADFAIYHRFTNPLFEAFVRRCTADPRIQLFLLPRSASQHEQIRSWTSDRAWLVPEETDGANLIARADLVVSAGGTMNREAAVLGTPAVSLFMGETGAVDRWLAESGRITLVKDDAQLDALVIEKTPRRPPLAAPGLHDEIVRVIEAFGTRA